MSDPRLVLWVALGGAIGAVARHLVQVALAAHPFPYGTLIVNVTGSFLLAALLFHDLANGSVPPEMRLFLGVGLLGAFTTMSSLGFETMMLYTSGSPGKAALNAALNLVLSLAAAAGGWAIVTYAMRPTA